LEKSVAPLNGDQLQNLSATSSSPSSPFAPAQHIVPPQQSLVSDDIPFRNGEDLIVEILINPRGTINLYIKDFIGLAVDIEGLDSAMILEQATLLRVSATAQEVSEFKPLPQDDMDA
jgi:hypothetical protein